MINEISVMTERFLEVFRVVIRKNTLCFGRLSKHPLVKDMKAKALW